MAVSPSTWPSDAPRLRIEKSSSRRCATSTPETTTM